MPDSSIILNKHSFLENFENVNLMATSSNADIALINKDHQIVGYYCPVEVHSTRHKNIQEMKNEIKKLQDRIQELKQ